ncbi:MAG: 4-hydroxy-tetrahydrodipicolinate synthase [Cyclobacteriaceae bacterium]
MNLTGTGVALVTPFNKNLEVDYDGLKKVLDHTSVVDYWVVHGTTAESATTTAKEKAQILEFVKKNNASSRPIVYGLGGNNTGNIVEQLDTINFEGVSAILSVCPYYNKPTQDGLYAHFYEIADASPIPLVLYNVPGRTSSNLDAETTLRLAEHKNIIGIKEASGNLHQCTDIIKNAPKGFALISGDDLITLPLIALGGKGVISVLANALPQTMKNLVDTALASRYEKARLHLYDYFHLNPLMYREANPVGVKQVLKELGLCENCVRLPLIAASVELQAAIKKQLKK